jgi:purine-nucleoside phosphorylase
MTTAPNGRPEADGDSPMGGMPMGVMIEEAVSFIRTRTKLVPEVGIILGTGLGGLVREIDIEATIDYAEIPHFPVSTVESHQGRLIIGRLAGATVAAMQGRFHLYEGYTMRQIAFPVRVMAEGPGLGVRTLLISNAAGGLNPAFRKGDLMLIEDHINLLGGNPLIGPNDAGLGPRFPDMSAPWDPGLIAAARRAAAPACSSRSPARTSRRARSTAS